LLWLLAAAEETDSKITESAVRTVREQAFQEYTDHLLHPFSEHHRLIHQAIQELDKEQDPDVIQTGAIYTRYNDLCESYSVDSLSNRRISDYLKHLERLDLIEADYHYGGKRGKTRRITLSDL
jgi:Cdc6-like AAA superfamily ATPase